MYVILDLEWAFNKKGKAFPTQLAAARVDSYWSIVDTYSSLIAPPHRLDCDLSQIGYSGHERTEFEDAKCAKQVFGGLLEWLRADDILCWWHGEAANFFDKLCHIQTDRGYAQKSVILNEYVYCHLHSIDGLPKNPYRIAKHLGICTPELMHEAQNDVKAITMLLAGIAFEQQYLEAPPPRFDDNKAEPSSMPLYIVDIQRGVVHRPGCEQIAPGCAMLEHQLMRTCIRRQFVPCKCCESEYKAALRQRNEEIITKSEYNFIFTPDSGVFHKYTCERMRSARMILGTIRYNSAVNSGRKPCKLCHPSPNDVPRPNVYAGKMHGSGTQHKTRSFSKEINQAIARYEQAKKEREQGFSNIVGMDKCEINDLITLTQTENVFWAATGYRTFHTRNCQKMNGLKGLKGFSHYADAIRGGYAPCKHCKPTAKMDISVSIPIFSRERANDSVSVLENACRKNGYAFSFDAPFFIFITPVGIWRINTGAKPYELHHVNLAVMPNNRNDFHMQPKIFLSLRDAFDYIHRHDKSLLDKREMGLLPLRRKA